MIVNRILDLAIFRGRYGPLGPRAAGIALTCACITRQGA